MEGSAPAPPASIPEPPPAPTVASSDAVETYRRYLLNLEAALERGSREQRARVANSAQTNLPQVDAMMELLQTEIRRAVDSKDAAALREMSQLRTTLHALLRRVRTRVDAELAVARTGALTPVGGLTGVAGRRLPPRMGVAAAAGRESSRRVLTIGVVTGVVVIGLVAFGLIRTGTVVVPNVVAQKNSAPIVQSVAVVVNEHFVAAKPNAKDPEQDPFGFEIGWTVNGKQHGQPTASLPIEMVPPGSKVDIFVVAVDVHGARSPVATTKWVRPGEPPAPPAPFGSPAPPARPLELAK